MTAVSKKVYFDALGDFVDKYNNTVHRTIKMKPIGVASDSYTKDSNVSKPKFKVGNHIRTSKYKTIFATGYAQNWSEEVFVVSKIKHTVLVTYIIRDLNGEKTAGSFYEKQLQEAN